MIVINNIIDNININNIDNIGSIPYVFPWLGLVVAMENDGESELALSSDGK